MDAQILWTLRSAFAYSMAVGSLAPTARCLVGNDDMRSRQVQAERVGAMALASLRWLHFVCTVEERQVADDSAHLAIKQDRITGAIEESKLPS
jgi:hypothetical protein